MQGMQGIRYGQVVYWCLEKILQRRKVVCFSQTGNSLSATALPNLRRFFSKAKLQMGVFSSPSNTGAPPKKETVTIELAECGPMVKFSFVYIILWTYIFWLRQGAQGVTMFIRPFVCPFVRPSVRS